MAVYIVKRLTWLPFLLLAVSFITFVLGFYGPGDPAQVRLGARATPESVARVRDQMGLNRPFFIQYGDYVQKAIRGDLGESYARDGHTVIEIIGRKVGVSAQFGLAAIVLSLSLGFAQDAPLAAAHVQHSSTRI